MIDIPEINLCRRCGVKSEDNLDVVFSGSFYNGIRFAHVECFRCSSRGPEVDAEDIGELECPQRDVMVMAVDAWNEVN